MIQGKQTNQITCDSCGSSNTDPIAPCKRFYRNDEVVICGHCKAQEVLTNLEPIPWVDSTREAVGEKRRSLLEANTN